MSSKEVSSKNFNCIKANAILILILALNVDTNRVSLAEIRDRKQSLHKTTAQHVFTDKFKTPGISKYLGVCISAITLSKYHMATSTWYFLCLSCSFSDVESDPRFVNIN